VQIPMTGLAGPPLTAAVAALIADHTGKIQGPSKVCIMC
jgi:hypothetical protein